MTARQQLLAMAATAALLALPMLAMAQSATSVDRAAGATTQTMPGSSSHNQVVDSRTLREGRRASRLIGASVYNDSAETIGEVDDLLIPREGGPPVAIISVGGFLGIGAKLVAVPYDNLRMGSSRWTLPGATKESLNALPGFSYEAPASRG